MRRDAGNNFAKATNLMVGQQVSNRIGGRDRFDVYKISLSQRSSFKVQMNLRGAKASMELFHSNLTKLGGSKSRSNQSMTGELSAGTYYIRVRSNGKAGNYRLRTTANPLTSAVPSTPGGNAGGNSGGSTGSPAGVVKLIEDVGDFMSTAYDVGVLSGTRLYSQQVTGTDIDLYKFQLSKPSSVSAQLTGLTDYTYVRVLYDADNNGTVSEGDRISSEYGYTNNKAESNVQLGAGTYFVAVQPYYSSSSSGYTLNLSAQEVPGISDNDPGTTISTAKPVTFTTGVATYKDFVGSVDQGDVYRVVFPQGVRLNASMNGLTDYAHLQLLSDNDKDGAFDRDPLASDYGYKVRNVSLTKDLGAGTYFVRVVPYYGQSNTMYNLSLSYQFL